MNHSSLIAKFMSSSPFSEEQTSLKAVPANIAQSPSSNQEESLWANASSSAGELAVDVYQTDEEIVIVSAIAGVLVADLDIAISNDMLTIRGTRKAPDSISPKNYLYQECYWGPFSRSIILPHPVRPEAVVAELAKGILTIHLPKANANQSVPIIAYDDDEV